MAVQLNNDELRSELASASSTIHELQNKIKRLESDSKTVIEKYNQKEQYSRLHSIRIHGLCEKENEKCKETVVELLQQKLDLSNINDVDIDKVHILPGLTNDGKPRSVIVMFFKHDHKTAVLKQRRKLKGSGVVIVEDLTRTNAGVMNIFRNDERFESVWSQEGVIKAKIKNGHIVRVSSVDTTDDIIRRFSPGGGVI